MFVAIFAYITLTARKREIKKMIKVKRVSHAFLKDYDIEIAMYKWSTDEYGRVIRKGIYLSGDASVWDLLHEFIHYLSHIFKFPQTILDFMDIIMHPKWWCCQNCKEHQRK